MARRASIVIAVFASLLAACGGDSGGATTTSQPAPVTSTTTPTPVTTETSAAATTAPMGGPTWFDGLAAGTCFDDAFTDDGDFDFSIPPVLTDCGGPHDNEIVAIVPLGEGGDPYPGEDVLLQASTAACDETRQDFLGGRYFDIADVLGFEVFPDETDWAAGARDAVCAVFGWDDLIGTVRSGTLDGGDTPLAILFESGNLDVWLIDPQTGEATSNITDDAAVEILNPVAWTPDGSRIAYGTSEGDDIWIVDAAGGQPEPLVSGPGSQTAPDFSPDGTRVAYVSDEAGTGDLDIFLMDLLTGTVTPLTDHPDRESSPEFSPDGSKIVFRARRGGNSDIYVMNADGSGVTRLTETPHFEGDPTWTPDGERIVFIADPLGNYDVFSMAADGSDVVNLTDHPADDEYPDVSPSGDRIVFNSNRLGGAHVWVMAIDGSDPTVLTGLGPTGFAKYAPAAQ